MQDVMVDLETLGTLPGSIILSIGAVAFDEFSIEEREFYRPIRRDTCENFGLTADPRTEKWWEDQNEEARKVLSDPNGVSIYNALDDFNAWLRSQFDDTVRIWGNGANFDNPLLAVAYDRVMIKPFYKFWNERCYRTVKNQFPDVKLERTGTYHNALDDARCQAEHLVRICQTRGWRLA
jgi:inhibitor of KinA sporulation pathway (predicted exonuclease)